MRRLIPTIPDEAVPRLIRFCVSRSALAPVRSKLSKIQPYLSPFVYQYQPVFFGPQDCSAILPSTMRTVRSARAANPRSWVTTINRPILPRHVAQN